LSTFLGHIFANAVHDSRRRHFPEAIGGLTRGTALAFAVGWCWLWLCRRHPLVAIAMFGFLRGLLGGRR
jgi:hypothetical protein